MVRSLFPILATTDLERSVAFYCGLLGGRITYQFPADGPPGYVAIDIGESHLGIGLNPAASTGEQRISLWIYVEDCDIAVTALRSAGSPVVIEPADQVWENGLQPCSILTATPC